MFVTSAPKHRSGLWSMGMFVMLLVDQVIHVVYGKAPWKSWNIPIWKGLTRITESNFGSPGALGWEQQCGDRHNTPAIAVPLVPVVLRDLCCSWRS